MAIQRYEVDPLDGEYRCDSGNWVQYEDHLAEMQEPLGLLRRLAEVDDIIDPKQHDRAVDMLALQVKEFLAKTDAPSVQSTHGKETDGPAVSD